MILNPLNGVYGSLIKFGIVVALIAALYGGYRYQLHKSFQEGVKTTEIKYEAQILAQNEVLQLKKKSAEKNLEIEFAKRQGEANEKIRNLNTTVSNLITGLQSRPTREDSSSLIASTSTTTNIAGATGAELYRGDAEFLTRQSARAEEIRLGLLSCYADYDAVKQSIESFPAK